MGAPEDNRARERQEGAGRSVAGSCCGRGLQAAARERSAYAYGDRKYFHDPPHRNQQDPNYGVRSDRLSLRAHVRIDVFAAEVDRAIAVAKKAAWATGGRNSRCISLDKTRNITPDPQKVEQPPSCACSIMWFRVTRLYAPKGHTPTSFRFLSKRPIGRVECT